ncbi:gastrula zinc finger protein XlCGF57.1-like [Culicoides brevitarsis]|uniref:gastrula zinc finger protein XlCGF57.1-like n=1 Tax=Culicoides brevitarsis TaxID=469753 RepID=UPI00307C2B3A
MEYIVEDDPTLSNSSYTFIELTEDIASESVVVIPHRIPAAKDYICGSCDDAFSLRSELDDHLRVKHPQIYTAISSYRNGDSHKKSEIEPLSTKSVQNVVIIESCFTCKCGEKFRRFLELEQHVEIEHTDEFHIVDNEPSPLNEELPYFEDDPIEEEKSENPNLLQKNEILEQEKVETTSFVTIDALRRARASQNDDKLSRAKHVCSICGEKYLTKTSFLTHMREKHPNNPEFVCEICSKGFFDIQELKKHKNLHNFKRFVCDVCSKSFPTKSKLTTHLDVHFRKNTVDCEICGKKFASKSGYRVHLKKHLGMWDKNLSCEVCNARFRYKYNLDLHKKSHTGQKDFLCEICDKRFSLQRHLQAHLDSHNGLRRFSCDICGQKFIRRQTWKRHLLTHTGEKAYKCEICSASYVDRRSLRKHLEKIHPDSNIEAFSKPLHSVPVIVEEQNITELDPNLVYAEIQM